MSDFTDWVESVVLVNEDDTEDDANEDDGLIVSVEEIIEEVAEKAKQPFAWLLGRRE